MLVSKAMGRCCTTRIINASSHLNSVTGGDNKVNVIISKYQPNVKCDEGSTPGPPWISCIGIFINMRASKITRRFGFADDESVQEVLPTIYEGGMTERSSSTYVAFHVRRCIIDKP